MAWPPVLIKSISSYGMAVFRSYLLLLRFFLVFSAALGFGGGVVLFHLRLTLGVGLEVLRVQARGLVFVRLDARQPLHQVRADLAGHLPWKAVVPIDLGMPLGLLDGEKIRQHRDVFSRPFE